MKYTKELLEVAVRDVSSFAELARRLNIAPIGSNTTHLAKRCQMYDIDVTHFTGQAHRKGRCARNRQTAAEVLTLSTPERGRIMPARLRRSLMEEGVAYRCQVCDNDGTWIGKPLPLQVDHINGKYWDNRKDNLRFICPNCHVQTETWGKANGIVA